MDVIEDVEWNEHTSGVRLMVNECTEEGVRQERLTVGAGLKLETGAAGSVAGGGASSDLQQVRRVGLQAVEAHVAAAGSEDGVAGLLLLLPETVTSPGGRSGSLVFMHVHRRKHPPPSTPPRVR